MSVQRGGYGDRLETGKITARIAEIIASVMPQALFLEYLFYATTKQRDTKRFVKYRKNG